MKKLYLAAWTIAAVVAFVMALTGVFGEIALVASGFMVLSLVYALVLWAALTKHGEPEREI